jgi:hypothetical protein
MSMLRFGIVTLVIAVPITPPVSNPAMYPAAHNGSCAMAGENSFVKTWRLQAERVEDRTTATKPRGLFPRHPQHSGANLMPAQLLRVTGRERFVVLLLYHAISGRSRV